MANEIKSIKIGSTEYPIYPDNALNADKLGNISAGFIYKYGYAYPYGLSNKPWHKVASFTQDVKSTQINTGISFYVGEFYYSRTYGILNIQIRNEQGDVNPSFCHVVWSVNCGIACDEFVVGHSYSGTKVTYNLYVNRSGWSSYSLKKISEQAWGGEHNNWTCYSATNGNEYCYATIPETNQYVSTNLILSNPPASHTHNYLPLSGGTLSSASTDVLTINSTHATYSGIRLNQSGADKGWVGYGKNDGVYLWNTAAGKHIGLNNDGTPYYGTSSSKKTILHSGNSSVSKSGETLTVKINGNECSLTNTWPSNYATTDTAQTIATTKNFNTKTNSLPLCISRTGSNDAEVVKIGVDDSRVYFNYINDETSCGFKFNMKNTDSESGGGAGANESHILMYGSSGGSVINADGFYKHDGTSVSYDGHTHGYWTWNENTIKGVKVNNAGYADSAGSAKDQTARDAAATAQSTADGKWTYNASTIAGVKVDNAVNADTVGGVPISSLGYGNRWRVYAGKSYVGWVKLIQWTTSTAGHWSPMPFRFSIYRNYNSPSPESYTLEICGGWDNATITQISGKSASRIITDFRLTKSSDSKTYWLEMYVNTSYSTYQNDCYCSVDSYYSFGGTPMCEIQSQSVTELYKISTKTIGGNVSVDGHNHDDRYYTETEIDTKLSGKANSTHGTHVTTSAQTWSGVKTFSSAPVFSAGFTSSSNVTVTGKVSASSGFYEESDSRLKDIEKPLEVDFNDLAKLQKIYFKFKSKPDKTEIGIIAQEVQEIYPEIVSENEYGNLIVAYDKLAVITLAAVDKLNERLEKIEKLLSI